MFRPRTPHQSSQAPYRLPKQQAMPSVQDLQFALGEATKRQGQAVELPWGSAPGAGYVLTILLASKEAEPLWALFQGDEPAGEPLWRHSCRDLALVHSLIFQAVPDDIVIQPQATSSPGRASAAGSNPSFISGQFPIAAVSDVKASLQGRLEDMQLPTLIQSIQMSKMSGRLHLFEHGNAAHIYFIEGHPVHAFTSETSGDQAIVEVTTWQEGDFAFYPGDKCGQQTVNRRLDSLVMEGIALLDQTKYLTENGLKPEIYLFRKDPNITLEEFKIRLSKEAPLDLAPQKAFYDLIDNRSRFQDILQRRPLTRPEWVPILFNLVKCGFVGFSQTPPNAGRAVGLSATEIDRSVIQKVQRDLIRGETGLYNYSAFLFFLEQEFSKSVILSMPLSIILFEARLSYGEAPQPLPLVALREIAARLEPLKRPFDIVAHYETFDFALILPGANSRVARTVGNRIAEALYAAPLCAGPPHRLLLAGGIASGPEDTQDLGRLISAAREAKARAKEAGVYVKMYAELEPAH